MTVNVRYYSLIFKINVPNVFLSDVFLSTDAINKYVPDLLTYKKYLLYMWNCNNVPNTCEEVAQKWNGLQKTIRREETNMEE